MKIGTKLIGSFAIVALLVAVVGAVGMIGFEPVFGFVTIMIFAGWIMTLFLIEPRRKKADVLTVELPT